MSSPLLPICPPEIGKPVRVVLKHWNTWALHTENMIAVDEDDCDWRFSECGSELSNDYNVIYWEYID